MPTINARENTLGVPVQYTNIQSQLSTLDGNIAWLLIGRLTIQSEISKPFKPSSIEGLNRIFVPLSYVFNLVGFEPFTQIDKSQIERLGYF